MKKKSIWSRIGDFLMGKGFYMVLLLCVMAIGGSSYYLYHLVTGSSAGGEQAVSAPAQVEVETESEATGPAISQYEVDQALADALAQAEAEAASEMTEASEEPSSDSADQQAAAEEAPEEEAAEAAAAEPEAPAVQETAETEMIDPSEPAQTTFAPPVPGEMVAAFSDTELTYNAALEDWRTHGGVDLSAQLGDPVSAVLDGEVLAVTDDLLLGTTITLNHGNGLMTIYSNLAEDVTVEQGDFVLAGETLGSVGSTAAGESHEGAWLHFAVEQDGVAVDPADYLE